MGATFSDFSCGAGTCARAFGWPRRDFRFSILAVGIPRRLQVEAPGRLLSWLRVGQMVGLARSGCAAVVAERPLVLSGTSSAPGFKYQNIGDCVRSDSEIGYRGISWYAHIHLLADGQLDTSYNPCPAPHHQGASPLIGERARTAGLHAV